MIGRITSLPALVCSVGAGDGAGVGDAVGLESFAVGAALADAVAAGLGAPGVFTATATVNDHAAGDLSVLGRVYVHRRRAAGASLGRSVIAMLVVVGIGAPRVRRPGSLYHGDERVVRSIFWVNMPATSSGVPDGRSVLGRRDVELRVQALADAG